MVNAPAPGRGGSYGRSALAFRTPVRDAGNSQTLVHSTGATMTPSSTRSGAFFTGSPGINAGPEIPPRTSSHPVRRGVARRGAIPDFNDEGIAGPSGTNSSSMAATSSEGGPSGA